MSTESKRLRELIDEQQSILNSIKAEAVAIDSQDLTQENELLKQELARVSDSESRLKQDNKNLTKALNETKTALFTKVANEKLLMFKKTQAKLEKTYYIDSDKLDSRLKKYENECLNSIDEVISAIEGYGKNEFDDILSKLNELKLEVDERKKRIEEYEAQQALNLKTKHAEDKNALKNEELTEDEKSSAMKQKSIESFIGLNILGKAGILLFIIGIILLGRFAYINMSDMFKGGMIYLLGIVLLVVGEIFHKKEKTVFSTTLLSGGVATLYAAATTCYFAFDLYNEKVTFILCVIITGISIALSKQVKSQIVCTFAAIGGYLPVVAIYMIGFGKAAADVTFLPVSCVYFCLLAGIIFFMTYNKKWHVAQYIGYGLHLIAIGGVAKCAYAVKDIIGYEYALPLACVFSIVSFILYLLMPSTKIIKRQLMQIEDSILLGLNTVSGAISVSITIHNCITDEIRANRAVGFVFIAFTIIYAFLSYISIREKSNKSTVSSIITSISTLLFSMMVIPFIFGFNYAGIGWVLEGLILALLSINNKSIVTKYAGLICMIASVYPAFNITVSYDISILELITGSIIISAFWIYSTISLSNKTGKKFDEWIDIIIEIATAIATPIFIDTIYQYIENSPQISYMSYFIKTAVDILAFIIVFIVIRFGALKNKASVAVSNLAGIVLFFVTFFELNINSDYMDARTLFDFVESPKHIAVIGIILLIAINICIEVYFANSVKAIINRFSAPVWIYVIAISLSTLMLITSVMMSQFNVKFSNVIISAVYILVACILLFVGFRRNFTVVRIGGLILILCAFAKLCFVDTLHLDSGWKIAAYFAFGAILIAISYVYQKFNKRLEESSINITDIKNE